MQQSRLCDIIIIKYDNCVYVKMSYAINYRPIVMKPIACEIIIKDNTSIIYGITIILYNRPFKN